MSGRVQFGCDGEQVEVDAAPGETLLSVLRERLGIMSVRTAARRRASAAAAPSSSTARHAWRASRRSPGSRAAR